MHSYSLTQRSLPTQAESTLVQTHWQCSVGVRLKEDSHIFKNKKDPKVEKREMKVSENIMEPRGNSKHRA